MKVLSFPLMLLMVALLLNACKKDDDSIVVNTLEVTNIGSHLATLNGEVVSNETPVTERGFFWSETNPDPDKTDNLFILADSSTDFSTELTGLESETKYYVRAYASDTKDIFYGKTVEFTTKAITTEYITNITQTTATGGGDIVSDGGATITARGVCWNTTGTPTIADSKTNDSTGIGTFTSNITGLIANTTYYLRAYFTNSNGTSYGNQIIFKTYDVGEVWWQKDTQTAVIPITSPKTGKIWMDRNLGASRAATSSKDEQAFGDLYQWGRDADGHQKRNSSTTETLSTSNSPGHGEFIISSRNWRSPKNGDLWQGVYGINNPCPHGYRIPTIAELEDELDTDSFSSITAFETPLKLVSADSRNILGSIGSHGYYGNYWSSTINGGDSKYWWFNDNSSSGFIGNIGMRAEGLSVRCIKD